jgi:hypothetical protein
MALIRSMAVPFAWQAKQKKTPSSRLTVIEALLSPWTGQQTLTSRCPSGASTP